MSSPFSKKFLDKNPLSPTSPLSQYNPSYVYEDPNKEGATVNPSDYDFNPDIQDISQTLPEGEYAGQTYVPADERDTMTSLRNTAADYRRAADSYNTLISGYKEKGMSPKNLSTDERADVKNRRKNLKNLQIKFYNLQGKAFPKRDR